MTAPAVECELCPRRCILANYQRGDCRVRVNVDGTLYTLVYGKPCATHVDPIEKKPLFHFLPGTAIYSIATAGCNLHCKYCQNWEISQTDPEDARNADLEPARVVAEAQRTGCISLAYTYSEPIIFYEYTLDASRLGRERGLKNVLVTAGYIEPAPQRELCKVADAANVDLKSLSDEFYREICGGRLEPVLKALTIFREEGLWLEVTNLIVPELNDAPSSITKLVRWVRDNLGADTPVHFSRFHPTYKLANLPPTPVATLTMARNIALEEGMKYPYVGNVAGHPGNNTYCPGCGQAVVERHGWYILAYRLDGNKCNKCGTTVPGLWAPPPGDVRWVF
jgi:pyruvate formate lyase activating enzyme